MYEALGSIEVVLIDDARLDDLLVARLASLVTGLPATAVAVLGQLADDSVHVRLTAADVWQALEKHGIAPRNLSADGAVVESLRETVDRYLGRLQRLYIGGHELPRSEADKAFAGLVEGRRVLVAGAAGMGKSVIVGQVTELARQAGWTVLALPADRLPDAGTAQALGAAIGLPGSPPIVLAGAAGGGDCLLVIDQLDAVSVASGRHVERLAIIEDVLADAAALPKLRVLLACRQFDLDNDRRLRVVATEDDTAVISVSPLERAAVLGMLVDAGLSTSLQAGLVDLLTVPQHLAIYVDLAAGSGADPSDVRSLTDLYDRYWQGKRQACRALRGGADEWVEVIDRLVDYMSVNQALTVPAAVLDDLADQVRVMASENVLIVDDHVVSFFHETFFDYCYARRFVSAGQSLRELLRAGEQDLFRRAQVRQVLTYERATAFDRYESDLGWLLSSDEVRMHIKALVVASMQTITDPKAAEWTILAPVAADADNPLRDRLWQTLRRNPAWYPVLQDNGAWSEWLSDQEAATVDRALWLLSGMTREHGDEAAGLLRSLPRDELWPGRLRGFVFRADMTASRQLCELILQGINDGHFDGDHRDDLWFTTQRLVDSRPECAVEVIAALFARTFAGNVDNPFEGIGPLATSRDTMAGDTVRAAALAAPRAFVEHLLQPLLEVAKRNARPNPQRHDVLRDAVWGYRIYRNRTSLADDFFEGMDDALRAVARSDPDVAEVAFARLREDRHEAAWFVLARGYAAKPDRFGDAAASWLADIPGALHLGYSDAEHWVSRELIAAISPTCGATQLDRLVDAVIGFTTPYERTYDGLKSRGYGELCLLNAIDPARRPERAERRLAELRRKFLRDDGQPPRGFQGGVVPPPIPEDRARKMSDDQWLRAMVRHGESGPRFDREGKFVGDAGTQAQVLEEVTRESPERFARLLLRIPDDVARSYVGAILRGLKGAHLEPVLLLDVCRYAGQIRGGEISGYVAELIQADAAMTLPDDLLDVIISIATARPDSTGDADQLATDGDGVEAARGAAALAVGALVGLHHDRLPRFQETLERLSTDEAVSVRQMTIAALTTILYVDADVALDLFRRSVADAADDLFASQYVEHFLNHAIRRGHYPEIADVLTQMMVSDVEKVRLAAVRQLTVAAYHHPELDSQVDVAIASHEAMRTEMIKVVADNVTVPNRRDRVFDLLSRAFADPAPNVRSAAVTCFYGLEKEPLADYVALLEAFMSSPALDDDAASTVLHMLLSARQPLPPVVLDLCDEIVAKHGAALGDITTASAAAGRYVAQLAVRLHAQQSNIEMRRRCLDLIDQLVTAGVEGIDADLAEIER